MNFRIDDKESEQFVGLSIPFATKYFTPGSTVYIGSLSDDSLAQRYVSGLHFYLSEIWDVAGSGGRLHVLRADNAANYQNGDTLLEKEAMEEIKNGNFAGVVSNDDYHRIGSIVDALDKSKVNDYLLLANKRLGNSAVEPTGCAKRLNERSQAFTQKVKLYLQCKNTYDPIIIGIPPCGTVYGRNLHSELEGSVYFDYIHNTELLEKMELKGKNKGRNVVITDSRPMPLRDCWTRTQREKNVVKRWGANEVFYLTEFASANNKTVDFCTNPSDNQAGMTKIVGILPSRRNVAKTKDCQIR